MFEIVNSLFVFVHLCIHMYLYESVVCQYATSNKLIPFMQITLLRPLYVALQFIASFVYLISRNLLF